MNNNTKIAFLTAYLSTGGAERVTINIAGYFFKKGTSVQIVAATILGNTLSKIPEGLKVFDLQNKKPLDSPSFYRNTKSLLKYIREEKPDVVISTSDYLNIALVFARFFSKNKFKIIVSQQVHVSAYLHELPGLNRLFIQMIQKMVIRNADLVIGVSQGVVTDLMERYNLHGQPGKFQTIYNPLYEEKIIDMAKEKITEPSFNVPGVKLITVGRLVKQKDHITLLEAFKLVLTELPDAHLFIIGIGAEEAALKKRALELGISDKIVFLGYTENPYAYVAKCDLFVLSSVYEGFGNVIVEALAAGTNVVSTDCPSGPAEILNNGEFGYLCPVGDAPLMRDAIIKALHNKMPASFLHNRATQFSIENISKKYMDAVFSILK
jgi:glycosyltransferase involved in cell wall biosynthesis